MKLTILLTTLAILNVSARGLSQSVTFSGQNVSLEKVLLVVEKQTGFVFLYSDSVLVMAKPVTISATNEPLNEFLKRLFVGQPLSYVAQDNNVIIGPAAPSIVRENLDIAPPSVKGLVKDSTGMPLSGATVMNKRTKKTVQTNAKGEFDIEGENGDVLVISYIGFEPQNILVSGPTVFSVLRVSSSPLDEIQIMAYGKTSKRLSTGNISTVKAAEIEKQPVNNPLLALTSRVPGLEIIQSSGIPGSPVKVKIRGTNSLSLNGNDPLFVVDGLPYLNEMGNSGFSFSDYTLTSAFSLINPNDIESIEVLKDADATSIYGSRGANGVILITTKKGRIGTNTINLNVQSGVGQVARKANLMNVEQYKAMRFEALKNVGANLNNPYYSEDTSALPSQYPDLFYWNGNTDWQEEMIGGTARYTDAQATISGGTSTMQYLIGGNYHKETTVFPGNSGDQKANVHFNINGSSLNQKFRTSLSGAYMSNWNQYPAQDFTQYITLAPTAPNLLRADGSLNWAPLEAYGSTFYTLQNNPYAVLFRPYRSNTNNLISNADISYKILPNFSAKITVGYSRMQSSSFSANPAAAQPPGVTPQRVSTFGNNVLQSIITEPQLAYNIIANKHKIDVLVGGSYQSRETNIALLQARGFSSDELMENQELATQYVNKNLSSQYKYTAVFGRLSYNFSEKYLINLNARRDGSSRFGPGKKFGNFGSVGAAWIFSEENFIKKNLSFLSFGKLRGSYGSAGNDGIDDYAYIERYRATEFNYLDAKGLISGGLVNRYFHWESIRKAELALELGFLKDRISLQGSYYRNRSSNQLQYLVLPNMAGDGNVIYNSPALVENNGIELVLSTVNIQGRVFK
ncbi:MAG: SusC/RagA family TonB-linked outer membrane protein, partial [Chitinophagaceae bacterium]|nr:SusC/RagA family TonB-linked outer membrane protein [Chitinophagaceae bacterium]